MREGAAVTGSDSLHFDIGRPVAFDVARDPVSLPILRNWCDAMGNSNLLHTDPAVAAGTQFGAVVAPLAMLDVWTKPGLVYQRDVSDPRGAAFDALDREGFTSAMAVSSELTQQRPLVLGDELHSTLTLEAVSPQKSTAVGPAHFVTTRQAFFAADTPVGDARFTVMKFRPVTDAKQRRGEHRTDGPVPTRAKAWPAARDELDTLVARGLSAGLGMPPVEIPITTTLIVAGALMTSDYFDAHHDRDAAIRRGSRDIFMNIHTTIGLIERCVDAWIGPNVCWRSISTRLGAPNHPGDVMTVGAELVSVNEHSGETRIGFRATNTLGVHAHGSIGVVLPI